MKTPTIALLSIVGTLKLLTATVNAQTPVPNVPVPAAKNAARLVTSGSPSSSNKDHKLDDPSCAYPISNSQNLVGSDPKSGNPHCYVCAKTMQISPSPIMTNTNQPTAINFSLKQILGGPIQVCASHATVDWGDGSKATVSEDSWNNCDGKPDAIVHDTVGKPLNVTLTHTYATGGRYCVSASFWGNHKYDGHDSCSVDCTVSSNATVIVRDTPP